MSIDLRDLFGSMLGNAAQSLGADNLYQNPILPKRKNGPPTMTLMPSQQAHQDVMDGIQIGGAGIFNPKQPIAGPRPPIGIAPGIHAFARGGKLDKNGINIVGEEGPEAIVDDEVIPLNPEMVAKSRQGGPPPMQIGNPVTQPMPDGQEQTMDSGSLQGTVSNEEMNPEDRVNQDILAAMQIKPSPWKDLGVGLVTGANNFFNKRDDVPRGWNEMKRDRKLQTLLPQQKVLRDIREAKTEAERKAADITLKGAQGQKAQADALKQLADIEHQQKADALAGKKWTKLVSGNKIYKQNADGTTEPWIDPVTKQQGVDKALVSARSPITGTAVDITPEALYSGESSVATGDANRTQQATIHNSDKQLETDKTNVANMMKYGDDVRSVLLKGAEANAQILASSPALSASNERVQSIAQQMPSMSEAYNAPDATDDQRADIQKQMNGLQDDMGKATNEFYGHLAKVQGGQELAKQLKQAMPQKPKMLKYSPVKPATVGHRVPSSKDPLGLFR